MTTFSIIIPIRPGGKPEALANLIKIDLSASQIEILVAEGHNPSRQRNEAVRQAQGEIIYFLDDDSLVQPDCLKRLADHFADPMVTVVGGPSLTPSTDSLLQQAIGSALASTLGAGGVRNRYQSRGTIRKTDEKELILCNLAVRRSAFISCGGFDERLYPNEENELLDRLRASGGILLHDPQLVVKRSQRRTLAAFARQMFRYGQGRARQTRIAGFSGIMPFAPLFCSSTCCPSPLPLPVSGRPRPCSICLPCRGLPLTRRGRRENLLLHCCSLFCTPCCIWQTAQAF